MSDFRIEWCDLESSGDGYIIKQKLPFLDASPSFIVPPLNSYQSERLSVHSCWVVTNADVVSGDPVVSVDLLSNLITPLFEDGFSNTEAASQGAIKKVVVTPVNSVYSFFIPKSVTLQNCITGLSFNNTTKELTVQRGDVVFSPASYTSRYRTSGSGSSYIEKRAWDAPAYNTVPVVQGVYNTSTSQEICGVHNVNRIESGNGSIVGGGTYEVLCSLRVYPTFDNSANPNQAPYSNNVSRYSIYESGACYASESGICYEFSQTENDTSADVKAYIEDFLKTWGTFTGGTAMCRLMYERRNGSYYLGENIRFWDA